MPLRADSITCGYDASRPVLRDLTASFSPGTLTAIIGPNGAGKTTLLRALLGVLTPSAGRVLLGDADLAALTPARRARSIVYVPQRSSLAFAYTARAVVAMGQYAERASLDHSTVSTALEQVGLLNVADTPFAALSAGQQQRITFARALAQLSLSTAHGGTVDSSRVLLADEPVASMDPRHALSTMAALRDLARHGLAVVVAMHDLTSVLRDADRSLVLSSGGTVIAAGPTAATVTPAVLREAFGVAFQEVASDGRLVALLPQLPGGTP